jgi:predicted nucleotidyltransferase component of viral defense system
MDLDTTIKGFSLTKDNLEKIIKEIISIDVDDNIILTLVNIKDIRLEDEYFGFTVNLNAEFDGLRTNLMVDVTTGDVITYKEVEFNYKTIFNDETISIMSYNFETIIAEKFETILSRNIDNTRMKDYYDLYMFVNLKWNDIDKNLLKEAIKNTSRKRETESFVESADKYIELIENDNSLKELWNSYISNYEYAKNISYNDTIKAIKVINDIL